MAASKFTFETKLINEIRNCPCIYNKSAPDYKDMGKKNKIWMDISRKASKPVDHCKARWKSLRYRFLKENVKLQAGIITMAGIQWVHYKSLLFLENHINPRKGIANSPHIKKSSMKAEYDDYDNFFETKIFNSTALINSVNYQPIMKNQPLMKNQPIIKNQPVIKSQPAEMINEPNYSYHNLSKLSKEKPQVFEDVKAKEKRKQETDSLIELYHKSLMGTGSTLNPNVQVQVSTTEPDIEILDTSSPIKEPPHKKKRRSSRKAVDKKFLNFLETVSNAFANSSYKDDNSHESFLQLLSSKLNRLPVWEQDDIKMEILNRLHQRVNDYERNNSQSKYNGIRY